MSRRSRLLASLLAQVPVALLASSASAQVNVETFRSDLREQPYFISLDGNLTGRLGNSEGITVGASVFAGVKMGDHLLFGKAQGDYAAANQVPSVAKSFAHVRYNYQIRSWVYAEAFSQIQQDKFQRLALRNVEGVGPRFALLQTPTFDLYYGTAYMFEYEVVSAQAADEPPAQKIAHRWSNYVSFVLNLDQRTRFTSVLYAQPRFDDFTDIRLLNESAITVVVKKPLSLKFGVLVRYDSRPPTGVLPADFESKNSFTLTF